MKVGEGTLTPAPHRQLPPDAKHGALWRSLDVNPYAFFEAARLDAVLARVAQREIAARKIEGQCLPVVNLRMRIAQSENCTSSRLDTFICAEPQLRAAREADCQVMLLTVEIQVDRDALFARQLRTGEMPLGGSACFSGFVPPLIKTMPQSLTMTKGERALFGKCIAIGAEAVHKFLHDARPMTFALLVRDLKLRSREITVRKKEICIELEEKAKRAAERAKKKKKNGEDDDEEEEVVDDNASESSSSDGDGPDDDDDAEQAMLAREEAARIEPLSSARCNEVEWLRLALEHRRCTTHIFYESHYHWRVVEERSRRVAASSFTDRNMLRTVLFTPDADEFWFLIGNAQRFREEAAAVDEEPPQQKEEAVEPVLPHVVDLPLLQKQPGAAVPLPIVRIMQPQRLGWLDHFDTLPHSLITLYEWEMYARTRMIALMTLCRASDESVDGATRAAAWEFWGLRTYPNRSGAKRHILQALGVRAVQCERSHTVIAMGYLALIARHNPDMRESLIYAELLWHRYQKSLLSIGDEDDDEDDSELRELCASFDRFWDRSEENIFESTSPHFVNSARKIERDWMEQAAVKQ